MALLCWRVSWSCIVGRSSCRRVLLVLGGALLARHWPRVAPGARRGTARGVWRVVAHVQSGWVALGRCIFRLYFFC